MIFVKKVLLRRRLYIRVLQRDSSVLWALEWRMLDSRFNVGKLHKKDAERRIERKSRIWLVIYSEFAISDPNFSIIWNGQSHSQSLNELYYCFFFICIIWAFTTLIHIGFYSRSMVLFFVLFTLFLHKLECHCFLSKIVRLKWHILNLIIRIYNVIRTEITDFENLLKANTKRQKHIR